MSGDASPRPAVRAPEADVPIWVFGYGSLIYKADFEFIDRKRATLQGWSRRFWQGSHDHRGTPEAPGRVVTLVREPGAVCVGAAYLVSPTVFTHLDHREKNGYARVVTEVDFGAGTSHAGVVYLAEAENEAWLGPASERDIAAQIAAARGPSGPNRDYVLGLAAALRELDTVDAHVFAIEAALLSHR